MGGSADVVVVGAGLAGLMAARTLTRAGVAVAVVEAKDRVGGRTWSGGLDGAEGLDFGGQWTGPGQPRMSALIDELGLETRATYAKGRKIMVLGDKLSTYTGTIPRISPLKLIWMQLAIMRIEHLRKQLDKATPWTAKRAREWDGQTLEGWMRGAIKNPAAMALMTAAGRVVFGSDAHELSLLHFLHYVNSSGGLLKLIETHGGNQDCGVVGGAQQLSERLAEALEAVTLDAPVRRVLQDDDGVTVETDAGTWRGKRLIFAAPPPAADRIDWTPRMPRLRDQLTQRTRMGATIKCFALYDQPFWRARGLSGESVNTTGPVNVTFDNVTPAGQPGLLAFVTGAPARGWSDRPAAERRRIVLDTLARYFGDEARRPTGYHECDWATVPFSDGAPIATFPPGTLWGYGRALREPVGRIHWAGTETARESTGFMEGALESGDRVAAEVLASISHETSSETKEA